MWGHRPLRHRVFQSVLKRCRALKLLLIKISLEFLFVGLDLDELLLELAKILVQLLLVHLKPDNVLLLDAHLLVELVHFVSQIILLLTDSALILGALIFKQF